MRQKIQMVDLSAQYREIKHEIDQAIRQVIESSAFIAGADVRLFADELAEYNESSFALPVANGTDALQIALMALSLEEGDEVIVPAFTYAASAEVIALLRLKPVLVDVDTDTFNLNIHELEEALSERTRAIIPVHLFGQCCNMEPVLAFAARHHIAVIEDNAQSIGATYTFSDGHTAKSGTMGLMGCTSFFPSKNLGCYGDGGAILTAHDETAEIVRMICNHGQKEKYKHSIVGCNSRLDTIQAAILRVKLRHLNSYNAARHLAGTYYNDGLKEIEQIILPVQKPYSTHVYHQYTLRVPSRDRSSLREYLAQAGIPTMIYYPHSLDKQPAFEPLARTIGSLSASHLLVDEVLSLPMHAHLETKIQDYIIDRMRKYFLR